MTLNREQILKAKDSKTETVEVPEWGGTVEVKSMSGSERDAYEQSLIDVETRKPSLANIRAKLGAMTLVDDDGKLLFSEKDVRALGKKSAAALDRICDVAQSLNGLSNEDMEELAKNSKGAQKEENGSG